MQFCLELHFWSVKSQCQTHSYTLNIFPHLLACGSYLIVMTQYVKYLIEIKNKLWSQFELITSALIYMLNYHLYQKHKN
jgi:hypothetical protein